MEKAFLGPLFKIASVDGKSVGGGYRNFPKALGVIMCIKYIGIYLKVWSHLFEAKDDFPGIRVAEVGTPELKKTDGSR